jgi:superfamily II DNA or RNA helicase
MADKLVLTRKQVVGWCGQAVYDDGEARVTRGEVLRADVEGRVVTGLVVRPNGTMTCRFTVLPSGLVDSACGCYASREQGLVCAHVAAVAISLMRRATDPLREQRYLEEQRHARRKEACFDEGVARSPGGTPARVLLQLPADWADQFDRGEVAVQCALQLDNQPDPVAPDTLGKRRPVRLTRDDDTLLLVLEDIAETRLTGRLTMRAADFLNVVAVCQNRTLFVGDGTTVAVQAQSLPMIVRMDLDRENGELLFFAHTELPFLEAGRFPRYLAVHNRCWAFGAGHLWPVTPVLPLPYHGLYREPVVIPRANVMAFLANELPRLSQAVPFATDLTPDLFSSDPGTPVFHLRVKGSPASLAAELHADYGGQEVVAGAPEIPGAVSVPDPEDLLHYFTRNLPTEQRALARINAAGFAGDRGDTLGHVVGPRAVLNVLGGELTVLRREGWRIEIEGRVREHFDGLDMAVPVVSIETGGDGRDGFEVGIAYEAANGRRLSPAEIQRALLRGDSYLEQDGATVLIDRDAVESMRRVFQDCEAREGRAPGRFRLPAIYAPYVQSSLAALDGIDVEEPPDWRRRAALLNRDLRIAPEPLGALDPVLRPYQKEGVYWLRFLETSGFAGILADEMGLGKTLQTLAWLRLPRRKEAARGKPALIVGPTSLVENWAREAAQFTPELRCLVMSGSGRHDRWEEILRHDVVITSYALLRRDLDRYRELTFSAAILDEAQHIKNRATQNAVAACQIRAENRLVLTGTPVENSVADLWSILNFLMPGYLGAYDAFKADYEQPIAAGDREGEQAQQRLRRKLKPFLLRRLKRDVARDLPDKIQKTSFSALTPDQERIYTALLEQYRRKIGDLVSARGFERCRMEVLAILLRLRQACCHLELLPPEIRGNTPAEAPSAKLDQFLEILDEAIDGGHRMLVFSQFVGMLKLLRRALDARGVAYCYLDGGTQERLAECQRFNLDRAIPVFLISLKAGGTGLNLTGADMVVHFDPWWNPAVEDQATDRAHRIGQKRTVCSIKLITEHTVEEKVLALQQRKQAVIQATVGTTDEAVMQSLTWADVQDLLR